MRTTLNLDDDVMSAARALARSRGCSVGEVISELARRGLRPEPLARVAVGGFPVFPVSPDAPAITEEMVGTALDD